jgi:hypothetical protein
MNNLNRITQTFSYEICSHILNQFFNNKSRVDHLNSLLFETVKRTLQTRATAIKNIERLNAAERLELAWVS